MAACPACLVDSSEEELRNLVYDTFLPDPSEPADAWRRPQRGLPPSRPAARMYKNSRESKPRSPLNACCRCALWPSTGIPRWSNPDNSSRPSSCLIGFQFPSNAFGHERGGIQIQQHTTQYYIPNSYHQLVHDEMVAPISRILAAAT